MKILDLKHNDLFYVSTEVQQRFTATLTRMRVRPPQAWPEVFRAYNENKSDRWLVAANPNAPIANIRLTPALLEIDVPVMQMDDLPFHEAFKYHALSKANYSTGWDPEIFVVDAEEQVIPAFHFLPPKTTPVHHSEQISEGVTNGNSAAIYEDGFQAEFNTPAQSCHGYGMDAIRSGLAGILQAARRHNPAAKLTTKNLFRIPSVQLTTASDEQVSFGCMPSKNAYGLKPLVFEDARQVPYRCAGGHIHLGGGLVMKHLRNADAVVQNLDRYAALPCVALFAGIDDPVRRQFYGRAGEYRLPQHGLEYRVLSNAWLSHPAVAHLTNNMVRGALRTLDMKPDSADISSDEVQEIINNCDVPRSKQWIEKNWTIMEQLLVRELANSDAVAKSKNIWLDGVANVLPNYADIESNWKLSSSWKGHTDASQRTWTGFTKGLAA